MDNTGYWNALGALNRRQVLAGGMAAALLPAGRAETPLYSNPVTALDFTQPEDNLYAWAKTWSTLGDQPTYGGHSGIFYAVIGDKEIPVAGYVGFGINQSRFTDDGTLEIRAKDATFYTDLETGDLLETWDNPWTGERVDVIGYINGRADGRLGAEMPTSGFASSRYGWERNLVFDDQRRLIVEGDGDRIPFVLPWSQVGDRLLMSSRFRLNFPNPVSPARWPKASSGPRIQSTEHFTYFVDANAVADRSRPWAPFVAGFFRVIPWLPWMRMGQSGIDGKMFARSHSHKLTGTIDDVPRAVVDALEKQRPDMLTLDKEWQEGPWVSSWSYFAEHVPPEVSDN
jgi:hypothetical protein